MLYPVKAEVNDDDVHYRPTRTAQAFHASNKFVRGIMGPLGSGKSVMCCFEVYMRAHEQEPYRGIRKTKWVFARKTYGELQDTTLATWQQWFPESVCQIKRSKLPCSFATARKALALVMALRILSWLRTIPASAMSFVTRASR